MVQRLATQLYLPLESWSVDHHCVLQSQSTDLPGVGSEVTQGVCLANVSEFLEPAMGQNDSEAQPHTLTAFLQDPSSSLDCEALPAQRNNIDKEGGTLTALLVRKCVRQVCSNTLKIFW